MDKPRPIKIAHVMDSFHRSIDVYGKEHIEKVFNPNLVFDEVHIISLYDPNHYKDDEYWTLKIHPLAPPQQRAGMFFDLNYRLKSYLLINNIVKENEIKLLVHECGVPTTIALPMVISARVNKIPSIITLQNDYELLFKTEKSPILRLFTEIVMRFMLKSCTGIRSLSSYIMRYATKRGISKDKIEVISLISSIKGSKTRSNEEHKKKILKELGLEKKVKDRLIVITASKLYKQKNVKNMLLAFQKALEKYQEMVFLVYGDGKLERELKELTRVAGIDEHVFFQGHVPFKTLIKVMSIGDIFLFPTLFEGQPQVVVYAISSGLPIICSDYGAVTELVRKNKDGIWVNPMDVNEISKAILKLAEDEKFRTMLSEHKDYPKEQFSIKSINDKEEELYMKVIKSNF